jgi:Iap family predicted aminopeptidase
MLHDELQAVWGRTRSRYHGPMFGRAAFLGSIAALLFAAGTDMTEYRKSANQLIAAALKDDSGLNRLQYLCDRIGNRLSGSKALEQAVSWSEEEMKRAGLANVRTIPVKVPHWVRGRESAEMVDPLAKPLFMLGLGGSIATPPGGITAEVAVVSDFNQLEKLGRTGVQGKIVLYDAPFVTYDKTVTYRSQGASRAARLGAVAALVRSIAPRSLRDPHTGAMNYTDAGPRIPAAAVSVEDAEYLHRLVQSGQRVRVHLEMEAHFEPDADSADVMGEIVGREKPDEIVVIGGHLDSWDVGQGAHDDGAGAIAALEAAALIRQAGLHPRRTIRVVFWTNEENGGRGGDEYRKWAGDQVKKHIAAIEMDGGAETPVGFDLGSKTVPADFRNRAAAIAGLLKSIGADKMSVGDGEADIEPLMNLGVPAFGLRTTMAHYFDYHHSQADTFDKIVPEDFRKCVAAMAVMSYVLADSE